MLHITATKDIVFHTEDNSNKKLSSPFSIMAISRVQFSKRLNFKILVKVGVY
jgi:hypothetical protein